MITHYDLFAGIGGFSLALEEVFYDETIEHIFCEWEPFPTAVLKKHWPDGTYYGDIAELVADTDSGGRRAGIQERTSEGSGRGHERCITVVTGGFPCQPFSHAGQRKGTADDRYQWPNMFRVIQNVAPDWVIAENVRGLTTWSEGMVLETVCTDLESEGYEVQPIVIPAAGVDAPHRRERVWIIANRSSKRQGTEVRQGTRTEVPQHSSKSGVTPNTASQRVNTDKGTNRGHAPRKEQLGFSKTRSHSLNAHSWDRDWREVALATCDARMDDGLPRRMDGVTISHAKWRNLSIKAYGNAIVPQVAMQIFQAIKITEGIKS